ncbi:MAG: type minor pilin protein PilW, partial [Pseudomonadota bacterium]
MPYPNTHTTRYQAGFTLIELMVSITLGLGILAGLVGVLSANSYNARSNERTSDLITNGRFALNLLKQELRQAGFRGYTWADPSTPLALGTLTNECLQTGATAGSFVSNLRQGIWGANNTNPFSSTCIPETSFADGNDVFVIRRVEAIPTTPSKANTLYFLSSYAQGQMFRGTTAPTFINNPEPLASFEVKAHVYYISPFTVSGETTQIPALWRVALDDSARMQPEL